MLPRLILHNAMSADGRFDWIEPDLGVFYSIAERFGEDATLAGSETMLTAYPAEQAESGDEEPEPSEFEPSGSLPLLVVPDSRGRLRFWRKILREPYWRGGVALCSRATPPDYLAYLEKVGVGHIVAGDDRVDMRAALEELAARYGVKVVRADCGGTLNGVLLRAGLVDEVSLVIDPTWWEAPASVRSSSPPTWNRRTASSPWSSSAWRSWRAAPSGSTTAW